MNKETVKGAIDQAVGGAKRHVGEMTGDIGTQIEGTVQQVKGKLESALGELKDNINRPPASDVPRSGSILRD